MSTVSFHVAKPQRLGFLEGEIRVPEDFDQMNAESIFALFAGEAPGDDVNEDMGASPQTTTFSRGTVIK